MSKKSMLILFVMLLLMGVADATTVSQINNGLIFSWTVNSTFNGTSDYVSIPNINTNVYNTSRYTVHGTTYDAKIINGTNLLYAAARNTSNPSYVGVADVELSTGTTVFYWHNDSWPAGIGAESIYKYNDTGTYLIADADADNYVYEMWPNHTKRWIYTLYTSDAQPIDYGGIDAILLSADDYVRIIRRDDQSTLWQDTNYTYANDADYRVIGGVPYIVVADFQSHKVNVTNLLNHVVTFTYTLTTSTAGPYDANWISDTEILIAGGTPNQWAFTLDISSSTVTWRSNYLTSTVISAKKINSTHVLIGDNTEYVVISNMSHPNVYSGLTVGAWIKPDTFATYNTVVTNTGTSARGSGFGLFQDGARNINAIIYNFSGFKKIKTTTGTTTAGNWTYVTVAYHPNGTMIMYLNASQDTTLSNIDNITIADRQTIIGAYFNHASDFFDGTIREVKIWNRALTNVEIQDYYNNNILPDPISPIAITSSNPFFELMLVIVILILAISMMNGYNNKSIGTMAVEAIMIAIAIVLLFSE